MKRSAPTPVQTATLIEAPSLSFAVIRTAFIGVSFVVLVLLGLFCFLGARSQRPQQLAAPKAAIASPLRIVAVSPVTVDL